MKCFLISSILVAYNCKIVYDCVDIVTFCIILLLEGVSFKESVVLVPHYWSSLKRRSACFGNGPFL
jgi:hypothetical protein